MMNMSESKKTKILKIIYTSITVICVLFIYFQSVLPAGKSGEESSRVVQWLNFICSQLNFNFSFSHHFVRKMAHFTEFAILGFSVYYTVSIYIRKKVLSSLLGISGYILVACTDESIQLFSVGRACSFNDIVIDVLGSTFGFVFAFLLSFIIAKIKKSRKQGC